MLFECQRCETTFTAPPSRDGRKRYCSKQCSYAAKRKASPIATCLGCGRTFRQNRPSRQARFCSKACASRHTAKTRPTTKGRYVTSKGYVAIYQPNHPNTSKGGYMMEHRLTMEAQIGRYLMSNEIVHHRDGNRQNNALSNLDLMFKDAHDRLPKERTGVVQCPHCARMIRLSRPARLVAQTSRK